MKVDCPLSEDEVKANESGMIVWFDLEARERPQSQRTEAQRRHRRVLLLQGVLHVLFADGGAFLLSDAEGGCPARDLRSRGKGARRELRGVPLLRHEHL